MILPLAGVIALSACGDDSSPDAGPADSGVHADATVDPADSGVHPDADSGEHPDADTGVHPDADTGVHPDADTGVEVPRAMIFLHTNDEHSHHLGFGPELDDFPTPAPSTNTEIVGGLKRRAKVIQDLKSEAAISSTPLALVSAGDQMMGTLFHIGNAAAPAVDYAVTTALQYDVITLGNHEFDFGVGVITNALSTGGISLTGNPGIMRVPVVASNIRFSMSAATDDAMAALYAPEGGTGKPLRRFHVQTFGSGDTAVTIGFVGVMGLDAALVAPFKSPVRFSLPSTTTACTSDDQCPGSACLPPVTDPTATSGFCAATTNESDAPSVFPQIVADIATTVAELRQRNVDLVVAVSHSGVDERELAMLEATGMSPADASVSEEILLVKGVDAALAEAGLKGIDVVIGGHSHTALHAPLEIPNPRSGITSYIVQAGSYGRYVGKLKLTQTAAGAPWTLDATSSGLHPVDASVSTSGLAALTEIVLDTVIGGLINGLENTVISRAGDGLIYPGEHCDGTVIPNGGNCVGVVPFATGGTLGCEVNRQIDLSGCTTSLQTCGNGIVETGEMCDGAAPIDCATLGYDGGALGCNANCTYDFESCQAFFPSLLEAALNFQQPGAPIRNDPNTTGDLFFHVLGSTAFDVPTPAPNRESNLMNLVTDAARYSLSAVSQRGAQDPIRVAINANGVIRDPIQRGQTGALGFSDLFRVLPLGVSPIENTPGYPLVDFWMTARELRAALEIGVNQGMAADSFWLGLSGARVEYDLSLPSFDPRSPATTGRITKITLNEIGKIAPWDDASFEEVALYDTSRGAGDLAYDDPERLIHVATSLYILLFGEALGQCPRDDEGVQYAECRACSTNADCSALAPTCDPQQGRCRGGNPVAFRVRSLAPINEFGFYQEVKEFLALIHYVRNLPGNGALPDVYNQPVPRRLCCVGPACDADRVCAPQGS
ncbi:bifunctional metallophosphatase/5'-nucleotidase [Myxococcota bacterium]|nr:bifunctional metallophosphatase/5'-nucleotidase [Myxococcota bacterium]